MSSDLQTTYFNTHDEHHFINLIPDSFREAVLKIPPYFLELSEKDLIKEVYGDTPNEIDTLIKMEFWDLYEANFEKKIPITISKLIKGTCDQMTFRKLLTESGRVAYIIRQPTKLQNRIKYAHSFAVNEMIKLLTEPEPINVRTGVPDAKLKQLKFQIYQYLDQRLHGSLIQRMQVEQKTLQVNIDGNPSQEKQKPQTAEELEARLKEVETELLQLQPAQLQPPAADIIVVEQVYEEAGKVSKEFERER